MKVAVVDYGAGNLRSVLSALRSIDCDTVVVESRDDVRAAGAMILPGVGAAADTMENLRRRGLSDVVIRWIDADRPFMGICMGLQVLFDDSTEGGGQECLRVLPGHVVRLPSSEKVPHMGWNQVQFDAANPLFRGIPNGSDFYFVHSYVAEPHDRTIVAGETEYGIRFCSVVQKDNLVATQFHPEKSGPAGLRLYRNFLSTIAG
ncbi:MAG: imidazole glycerol phosphate synthase subunit HisH [Dehalococcoidia bacterium]|jgi:glutamine amidotransferase|nr:imidazole glycerol phosphate synthase subunit HisH [Dehalococcoidia bacterium]